MTWLWPIHTGKTFFDVWCIFHLAFWLFVGSVLWARRTSRPFALGWCLAFAYAWEASERFFERWWPQTWLNPESFINSVASDPLMCVLGLLGAWYALDHWRKP